VYNYEKLHKFIRYRVDVRALHKQVSKSNNQRVDQYRRKQCLCSVKEKTETTRVTINHIFKQLYAYKFVCVIHIIIILVITFTYS